MKTNVQKMISSILFLSLLGVGCATTARLSSLGSKVFVLNQGSIGKSCKLVGQVHVTTDSPPGWGGKPAEDLHNKLRNEAAAKGGNAIVIESGSYEVLRGTGSSIGTVYYCSELEGLK